MPLAEELYAGTSSHESLWTVSRLGRHAAGAKPGHVPTGAMFDFAYGGLDEELLFALYGDHIRSCDKCSQAVEVYARKRPSDPARLFEVPELSLCHYETMTYPLPQQAGARLKEFISERSGPLFIVAGEANPAVYTPDLGDVIRQRTEVSRRKGDPIPQVICGPAMGLDGGIRTSEDTIFPRLAEEGAIRLYVTQHRQRLHFRVSGEDSVYTEVYHEAGNPGDRCGFWYKSRPIASLFQRRFQAILAAGVARPAKRDDFVFFPMDTIRKIEQRVGDKFNSMTAGELAAIAASLS
ncbi:MAG TPA: hypothetical protein VGP73_03025 [Thermoanaerobaculia bacterium]